MGFYSLIYLLKKFLTRIPVKLLIMIIIFLLIIILKNVCFGADNTNYLCFTDINHKYWQLPIDSNAPAGVTGGKYSYIWSDTNPSNPNYFVFLKANGSPTIALDNGSLAYTSQNDCFAWFSQNPTTHTNYSFDNSTQSWSVSSSTYSQIRQLGMSDGNRQFLFTSRDAGTYTYNEPNSYNSNVSIKYTYFHPYVLNYNNQWDFNQLGISTASDLPIIGSNSHFWYDNNILFTVNGQLQYTLNVTNLMTEHQNYYYPCYYIWINKQDILDHVSFQDGDTFRMYLNCNMYSQDVSGVITDNYLLLDTVIDFDNSGDGGSSGSFDDTEILNAIGGLNQSVNNVTNAVNDLDSSVQDVNDSVQDVKDTVTDSNVSDSSLQLPTIDVNNPAQQGIENIFLNFYNAFCTGEAQDIIIPIPNTSKSFVLSANYLRDNLQNNNGSFIISFITAGWWYLIGGWIVKDVWAKIIKIQTGDVEDVQNDNVSTKML